MNFYLLFKSLHLIAVISWMAGLLYLPRIFVYHSEASHDSQKQVFKTMEKKLYNYIMIPAMLLSWLFGILLIYSLGFNIFKELWMQIKIISVLILTYYHLYLEYISKTLQQTIIENHQDFIELSMSCPQLYLLLLYLLLFSSL